MDNIPYLIEHFIKRTLFFCVLIQTIVVGIPAAIVLSQPHSFVKSFNFSPQPVSSVKKVKYYISWKNHGEFLFHTIPTDKNGNYIKPEAEKLGTKASHGCFRLPVLDAKWIYNNIPEGTKVVVHA